MSSHKLGSLVMIDQISDVLWQEKEFLPEIFHGGQMRGNCPCWEHKISKASGVTGYGVGKWGGGQSLPVSCRRRVISTTNTTTQNIHNRMSANATKPSH